MQTRTIRILRFRWVDEEGYDRFACQGETVELADEDAARGDADGAFITDEPEPVEESSAISIDSTDEELVTFVGSANVSEVVAAATDPEMAKRLLDAENGSTGNDPRKGVVEGLAAIAGQAE